MSPDPRLPDLRDGGVLTARCMCGREFLAPAGWNRCVALHILGALVVVFS